MIHLFLLSSHNTDTLATSSQMVANQDAKAAQAPVIETDNTAAVKAAIVSSEATKAAPVTHPLGPLTGEEISKGADLVRSVWPEGTKLQFKVNTLHEPEKKILAPWLVAERAGEKPAPLERKSFIVYTLRGTVSLPFHSTVTAQNAKLHYSTMSMRRLST